MKKGKKRPKFFSTKYFGFVLGLMIFAALYLINSYSKILDPLRMNMVDLSFSLKEIVNSSQNYEAVVFSDSMDHAISPAISIAAIDEGALSKFGRWPFPRYIHADLVNKTSRIQDQTKRENALFLDLFFIEPAENARYDATLIESMENHGRIFMETTFGKTQPDYHDVPFIPKQIYMIEKLGAVNNVSGDWSKMIPYYTSRPPLIPYIDAMTGYGHANYEEDLDGKYRKQAMVLRYVVLEESMEFESFGINSALNDDYEFFGWKDVHGVVHKIDYPVTEQVLNRLGNSLESRGQLKAVDTDGDNEIDHEFYSIGRYQNYFVPAITLSLALNYFNKSFEDIEVVLGDRLVIESPEVYNPETDSIEPYKIKVSQDVYGYENQSTGTVYESYKKIERLLESGEIQEDQIVRVLLEPAEYEVIDRLEIPIDDQGLMLINFMGLPSFAQSTARQTFPIRSYSGYASNPPGPDPATSRWNRSMALENEIVMVGAFAPGMASDQKTTPVGLMYGVEVHANALNTILMNKFLRPLPMSWNLLIVGIAIILVVFITSRIPTVWSLLITLFLIIASLFGMTMIFEKQSLVVDAVTPAIAMAFSFLTVVVYRVMTEEKDKRRIRGMFSTYVSPQVVDQMLELEKPPELGGVDKNLTVFFSDIRGFTTLSESLSPQELVSLLNRYLTIMTDIILDTGGTLDKYEGDAIMAFWGAPLTQEDHAYRACKASLNQIKALKELNEELPPEKKINIGIGLNSGIMTVGNMGSLQRMDYTLIGDNVNLGARLEGTNKQYGTQIIISENTYDLVRDKVIVRELDNIRVKGKNKPVVIFELLECLE